MSLAKGHYFLANGLPPLTGGARFIFTAAFASPYIGYDNGAHGTLIQDTTPWAFERLDVDYSYGDLYVESALLAADVVANGDGGRSLKIDDGFSITTVPLASLTIVGDILRQYGSAVSLSPSATYEVWVE